MGLSSFPSSSEGLLPMLVVTLVYVVALFKNTARSLLQTRHSDRTSQAEDEVPTITEGRILVTRFKSLCHKRSSGGGGKGHRAGTERIVAAECCVCLSGFKAEEEVSELVSCKHFFHRWCLQKWFDNCCNSAASPCPLCRSLR